MSDDLPIHIKHLFISPGHNYFGHHGMPAGEHPIIEVPSIHCLAGRGIEDDRFLDFKASYKGQITFFALEVYEELCGQFGVKDKSPGVFRRNAITAGADLPALIGKEFSIQGVRFLGNRRIGSLLLDEQRLRARRGGGHARPGRSPREDSERRGDPAFLITGLLPSQPFSLSAFSHITSRSPGRCQCLPARACAVRESRGCDSGQDCDDPEA